MSKMNQLAAMLTMAAMSGGSFIASGSGDELETFTPFPKEPNIPKGCKEYWFNERGYFSTEKMRRDEIVFKCIASNEKVAKKKFDKWMSNSNVV